MSHGDSLTTAKRARVKPAVDVASRSSTAHGAGAPARSRRPSADQGSPGDSWIFTKPLRDESGKPAGDVYATCVAFTLGSNPKATCDGTLQLKQGTLAFSQVFNIEDESRRAAITGGTGAFAGATGASRAGGELGQGYEIKLLLR